MYHSHLLINVGDNPDRPDWNVSRCWLRNLYRVHQRLCMAFPSGIPARYEERIAAYCEPYSSAGSSDLRDLPGEPATTDVHYARSDEAGFLFRIDYPVYYGVNGKAERSGRGLRRPVIVVQSATRPDWDYAFGLNEDAVDDRDRPIGNASFLLAARPQVKEINIAIEGETLVLTCPERPNQDLRIKRGDQARFRLRANPIHAKDGRRHRPHIPSDAFNAGGEVRERAFVKAHEEWLERKLGDAADSVECFALDHNGGRVDTLVTGWAWGWRTKYEPQPKQRMQWWSATFEGTFRVKDTAALKSLLECGIGPAKAFGFGLLSIAPVRP